MNLKSKLVLLFAVVALAVAGLVAAPPVTSMPNWCQECAATGDCFACCRCNGGTVNACIHACGG
jgi:hypothetical protein